LAWYVFLLAAAGGVAFIVWNFHRKTAARKAASEARFEEMFKGRPQLPANSHSTSPAATTPGGTPVPAKAPPAPPVTPSAAVQRFMGQTESQLYFLLKAALADLEVFAGVSLTRIVGAAGDGREREQQLRRLSQYQLDFVVCDKSMRVVAVVEVESAAGAAAVGDQRFKSDMLKQAGIRLVRVNPAELPRLEQVRDLINVGPAQDGAA